MGKKIPAANLDWKKIHALEIFCPPPPPPGISNGPPLTILLILMVRPLQFYYYYHRPRPRHRHRYCFCYCYCYWYLSLIFSYVGTSQNVLGSEPCHTQEQNIINQISEWITWVEQCVALKRTRQEFSTTIHNRVCWQLWYIIRFFFTIVLRRG